MATQPTNLPVPSETPRDLKFNAGKIDEFVTSLVNTYIDRFGKQHYTIEGLRWLAQQAIAQYGWIPVGTFQAGATLTLPNQILKDETDGEYYRWDGSFLPSGKVVPAGSTPASSGGLGVDKWLSVGDSLLRSELLAGPIRGRGTGLALRDFYSVRDWGVIGDGTDETAKLQSAIDGVATLGGGTLLIPAGMKIKCWERLYGRKGVSIKCDSTSWLDFRGAPWLTPNNNMALLGYYGTAGSFITPTADMVVGSNKIAVPDASVFKIGDMLELSMNDKGKWEDTSTEVTAGQLAIVTGVFTATNNIVLSEPIYETLTLAKSARIRIVDPIENVIIDGLGIIGNGRNPSGNGEQGLKIFFGRNVQIKNCRMKDVDTQSIGLVSCYGADIEKSKIDNPPLGTTGVISYSIAYSSSMHVKIHGNESINARHGIVSSHLDRSYGYYGVSRFIDIYHNNHDGNYGDLSSSGFPLAHAGISVHTDAEYVHAHYNTVIGCRYGVNFRTPNNRANRNNIHSCKVGVLFSEYWADSSADDNDIYDCDNPFATDSTPYEVARGLISICKNRLTRCGGAGMTFPTTVSSTLLYNNNVVTEPTVSGSTAVISAFNNVNFTANSNDIQVNDAIAIRANGIGMQLIKSNNLRSMVSANTNDLIFVVSASNFTVAYNTLTVPVGSAKGGIACPSRLTAPNSIATNNYRIEV